MRSIKMSFGLTTLRTKLGRCSSCMEYARCFSLSSNVQQWQYCRGRDTVQSHSKISTKSNAKQVTSGLSGTRSSRKAFPVTDLGRNRTELFTALREVSLLPERPGTQYDMSVVSPKHPPTCPKRKCFLLQSHLQQVYKLLPKAWLLAPWTCRAAEMVPGWMSVRPIIGASWKEQCIVCLWGRRKKGCPPFFGE